MALALALTKVKLRGHVGCSTSEIFHHWSEQQVVMLIGTMLVLPLHPKIHTSQQHYMWMRCHPNSEHIDFYVLKQDYQQPQPSRGTSHHWKGTCKRPYSQNNEFLNSLYNVPISSSTYVFNKHKTTLVLEELFPNH